MGKYVMPSNLTRFWNNVKIWANEKFVAKSAGKQLSTEDYTTAEKEKLAGLTKITVDSALSSTSTNPLQNKAINTALGGKVPTTRKVNNKALSADITLSASDVSAIPASQKGASNGVAELDVSGKVPASQLPSYVDDVLEGYLSGGKFYKESAHTTEIMGESGKIYTDLSTNKTYRWSGTAFIEISASLALGETSSTAYRGDRGKIAYDHSQAAHAPANAEQNVQSDWNVTDAASDAFIKNKPSSMPANGGNAATVGGHTVAADVPAGAKFTDTIYTHPTTDGNKHVPAGGASGQILRWSAAGTAVWGNDNNTTYSTFKGATASAAGGQGLVPAPAAGKQDSLLCADGSWAEPMTDAEIDAICV